MNNWQQQQNKAFSKRNLKFAKINLQEKKLVMELN